MDENIWNLTEEEMLQDYNEDGKKFDYLSSL